MSNNPCAIFFHCCVAEHADSDFPLGRCTVLTAISLCDVAENSLYLDRYLRMTDTIFHLHLVEYKTRRQVNQKAQSI